MKFSLLINMKMPTENFSANKYENANYQVLYKEDKILLGDKRDYGEQLTVVLLNPDIPCLCKQCRSRSVGF